MSTRGGTDVWCRIGAAILASTALLGSACGSDLPLADRPSDTGRVEDGGVVEGGPIAADDAGAVLPDAGDATKGGPPSGVLDPSFGGTGWVTRSGTAGPVDKPADDVGYGVAVDSLGRVVVGGASYGSIYHRGVVWRLDVVGTFDATFGTGGAWLSPAEVGNTLVSGVAVDPSDRPLVAGAGWRPSGSAYQAMTTWRLTTAGAPDASFNASGQAFASGDAGPSLARAITRDKGGAPIVAGFGNIAGSSSQTMAWRLTATGASDASLGSPNGFVLASGTSGWGGNRGDAIALDPSGKVVVGGSTRNAVGQSSAALWRFSGNGAVDTSFGGTGYVAFVNLGGQTTTSVDAVSGVAVDDSGGILFCGTTMGGNVQPRGFVARLTEAGALDTSFGQGGVIVFEPALATTGTAARGLTIDSQGRILVTGAVITTGDTAAVWRLTSTGAFDTSFGTFGQALVTVPGFVNAYAYAIAIDTTDRAVVAGFAAPFGNTNRTMLVFRLTP